MDRLAIERALGARVVSATRIAGGEGRAIERVTLADGRDVAVKTGASAEAFATEARGLAWLGDALRTAPVLAVLDTPALVLAWIAPGPSTHAEALGRGLARLHASEAPGFGLDHDNWLASIPWSNAASPDWPTFYAERRLVPLLARAIDRGASSRKMQRGIESVVRTLAARVGPSEPPARLHGDLWSGNVLWDATGIPVLIDPAVYGGHREVDLAMMRLFGGFDRRVFDAYAEAFPLAPGHRERVPLYQLLPLLAHCALFGGGYVSAVEDALDALGAA